MITKHAAGTATLLTAERCKNLRIDLWPDDGDDDDDNGQGFIAQSRGIV